jgi:acyl-[acyl-carrier-protein]-phospholipid O-acyltransferase/long-chain-fatty-acid--[acyl-carrier-protein] ligase
LTGKRLPEFDRPRSPRTESDTLDALPRPAAPATPEAGGRGFAALLALRVLTVLNDNLLRWLAIGLGKRAAGAAGTALVLTIGTAGFVLPFVVLAWLAGWLADRFPKRSVIVWAKLAEIGIAAGAAVVIGRGIGGDAGWAGLPVGLWLLLGTVIAIGVQAALMAPSILGAIPESVPAAKLSSANGVFALLTLAATLAGMAGGNWLADVTPLLTAESAAAATPVSFGTPATAALVGVAIAGWLAALRLKHVPAADPQAPPPVNALASTGRDLGELFSSRTLLATAVGIVFFWALAAIAQLNVDQFAFESGATSQTQIVPLLVALVGGIGLGSLLAGKLSRRGIDEGSAVDLGFVPLGGIVMAIGCFALALCGTGIFPADAATGAGASAGFPWRLVAPIVWLAVLGVGAGMFDVPLEAYLQEQSPPARRGSILASVNLLVFAGMFVASLIYGGLRTQVGVASTAPLVSARGLFAIFGVASLAATVAAVICAPRSSLRMLVRSIVQAGWRFRIVDEANMPATGPVVVVANHLSWLDGFLLPLASPRPIRMVVYGPNIQGKFLRMLADQWRFILFDPRPKSIGTALKTIQSGLAAGDVIGIFCEGGISRTGQLLGFKRGLEWLLEKVEAPIVPLSVDGLWGSLLTFSEGKYFSKRPRLWRRPITLTFGPALPVGAHPDQARIALQEVTTSAVARRLDPHAATAEAFDGCCLVRRDDRLVASLAAGDPLHDSLGLHAGRLLGIRATVVDPASVAAHVAATLVRDRATIWLARIEQVLALAAEPAAANGLADHLAVVVMPIARAADLPRAREAIDRFRAAFGIEPSVAYAPSEIGGLVAMNTPPSRIAWDHEVITKPDTVGRVVNGVAVWPRAGERSPLGLPSLAGNGIDDAADATLAIAATAPGTRRGTARAALLSDAFDIDKDGFLVPRTE